MPHTRFLPGEEPLINIKSGHYLPREFFLVNASSARVALGRDNSTQTAPVPPLCLES